MMEAVRLNVDYRAYFYTHEEAGAEKISVHLAQEINDEIWLYR